MIKGEAANRLSWAGRWLVGRRGPSDADAPQPSLPCRACVNVTWGSKGLTPWGAAVSSHPWTKPPPSLHHVIVCGGVGADS